MDIVTPKQKTSAGKPRLRGIPCKYLLLIEVALETKVGRHNRSARTESKELKT